MFLVEIVNSGNLGIFYGGVKKSRKSHVSKYSQGVNSLRVAQIFPSAPVGNSEFWRVCFGLPFNVLGEISQILDIQNLNHFGR